MAEIIKEVITPRWLKIKEMYEAGTNGSKKYGSGFMHPSNPLYLYARMSWRMRVD